MVSPGLKDSYGLMFWCPWNQILLEITEVKIERKKLIFALDYIIGIVIITFLDTALFITLSGVIILSENYNIIMLYKAQRV